MSQTLSKISEDTFSRDVAHVILVVVCSIIVQIGTKLMRNDLAPSVNALMRMKFGHNGRYTLGLNGNSMRQKTQTGPEIKI